MLAHQFYTLDTAHIAFHVRHGSISQVDYSTHCYERSDWPVQTFVAVHKLCDWLVRILAADWLARMFLAADWSVRVVSLVYLCLFVCSFLLVLLVWGSVPYLQQCFLDSRLAGDTRNNISRDIPRSAGNRNRYQ